MSNTDFDPDGSYANMVNQVQGNLRLATSVSPDDAARSIDLENSTGVPSPYISRELKEFDAKYKQALSRDMILSNPRIMDYVRAHPMNGAISQDDWGNLDNISTAHSNLHDATVSPWWQRYPALIGRGAGGGTAKLVGALGRVLGSDDISAAAQKMEESVNSNLPLSDQDQRGIMAQVMTGIGSMIPVAAGGIAAGAFGPEVAAGTLLARLGLGTGTLTAAGLMGTQAVEEKAEELEKAGLVPSSGLLAGTFAAHTALGALPLGLLSKRWEAIAPEMAKWGSDFLKRRAVDMTALAAVGELGQMIDAELASWSYNPNAKYAPDSTRILANMVMGLMFGSTFDLYKAYVNSGKHIPPGLGNKEIDGARFEQEKVNNQELDNLLDAVSKADTPEHGLAGEQKLKEYIDLHPPVSIGLDAAEAIKLYGGKTPTPGDNILGDMPNIAAQFDAAKNGNDIRVSVADYAKAVRANPELDKLFHDHRRIGKNGMSLDDIKNLQQAQQAQDEQAKVLLETPSIPRYVGGIADSGSPVLDAVKKSLAFDKILPMPSGFWTDKGLGLTGPGSLSERIGLKNQGATVNILHNEFAERLQGKTVPIKIVGQTTGGDLLRAIDINKMPGMTREVMQFFMDRENEMTPNIPVYILKREDIGKLRDLNRGEPAGYYDSDPKANYIVLSDALNRSSDNYLAHTIIHEMAHAATVLQMYKHPELKAIATKMMGEYKAWLEKNEPEALTPGVGKGNAQIKYAFSVKNPSEFVAQSWSAPEVIESLHRAGMSTDLKSMLKLGDKPGSFWDGIKALFQQALEKIFGKLPDTILKGVFKWSEDVHSQMVKGEPGEPIPPHPPIEPPGPTAEEMQLFEDQRALGYTKKSYEKFSKLVEEERDRDMKWKKEQAEKDAERYTTDWWKQDAEKMEPQAREAVYQQSAIAAERFLRFGYLGAAKLTKRKLNGDLLTDAQKASLHTDYFQKGRGGLDPNLIAPWFGYRTGDEMVSDLIGLSTSMKTLNLTPNQYVASLVKGKLQQMMVEKHGSLEENILKEAQDRVLSLTGINIAHADLIRVANLAGMDLSTPEAQAKARVSKEQLREMAENELNSVDKRGDMDATQLIDRAQKQGREVEQLLLTGKNIEAFKESQKRMITIWKTYEMREFEELEAKGEQKLKAHVKREPEAFATENAAQFHDFIQLFMNKFGKRISGDPVDLLKVMKDRGYKDFRDFVEKVNDPKNRLGGKIIPAPDWLKDVDFTKPVKLDDLTIGQSRSLWETLIALDQLGRKAKTVDVKDEQYTVDELVEQMIPQLQKSGTIIDVPVTGPEHARGHYFRLFDAGTMMVERWFNRLDLDNPRGIFNQIFSRLFTESANHYNALTKQYGKIFRELIESLKINLKEPLEAPVELTSIAGQRFTNWTRENLLTLMFNMGNKVNWTKMYKGRGLTDEQGNALWQYVMKNARPEEWQLVSQFGERIFNDIKANLIDPVYLKLSGFPPRNIQVWDVVTPYGTFKGWYYPLIKDRVALGKGAKTALAETIDGDDQFSIEIPNPHAKERTGALYELSLTMQDLASRLDKMLYDAAFRENYNTMRSVWEDPRLKKAIILYQGKERWDAVNDFFNRMANRDTFNSAAAREASGMNEFLRQNVMSFYVGLNIGTVLKHFPTALINSARRIGPLNLLRGYSYLYRTNEATGKYWSDWVNQQEEIQRRGRDWAERFGGAYRDFTQTTWPEAIRNWGSKPVAFSDMISSRAEFLGAYLKALDEGQTPAEAVFEASRSVRYSHGTTAPTNLPLIATGKGLHSWATSLYHFFGTMLQNRMETAFMLNRMYRLGREGELRQAANILPVLMADVFCYTVMPTVIEEVVTGLGREDRRGWGQRLLWGTFGGLANAVPYARDIVHSLEYGVDQGGGLASSAIQPMQQAVRDVQQALEGKKNIYNAKYAGNLIQDIINLTAYKYGTPREVGNIAKYGWNVSTGVEVPHSGIFRHDFPDWFEWGDVARGLTHGSQKMSKVK